MNQLIQAAIDSYQAQRTEAMAHLDLLFNDATMIGEHSDLLTDCLLYTSPSPRDDGVSRMPSSA